MDKKRTGGRATPKGTVPMARRLRVPSPDEHRHRVAVSASSRYTRPVPKARLRPRWHLFVGWTGVAVGVIVALLNDAMSIGEDLRLLPFGHSELYLILGALVAGSSSWFLGVFDRQATVYR